MTVKGTLKVAEWNEADVLGDLFRVSAVFVAEGALNGRFNVEYMMYTIHGRADDKSKDETAFRGFMRFEGAIGDYEGSFVLADAGLHTESGPESRFSVLPGTGRGGFEGVTGYGKYFSQDKKLLVEMTLYTEGADA